MNDIVKRIIESGYEAYIVGGYVRDYLLGMPSKDIDICTNAPIEEIMKLFEGRGRAFKEYYSFHIEENDYTYDITTYREELKYRRNKPVELKVAKDLKTDLLRRDFTINTFAIDSNGKLVDLLNARADLNAKLIRVVGNTYDKFNEDKTRIIRALRFASCLDFELDDEIIDFFSNKNAYLLNEVPKEYKKKELDKIFDSNGYERFFYIVDRFNIAKYLNISFDNIKKAYNRFGIWSQIETELHFSNKEKAIINGIRELVNKKEITYYDYSMYNKDVIFNAACILRKTNKIKLYEKISKIHSIIDIDLDMDFLIQNVRESDIIDAYKEIERSIIEGELSNDRSEIEYYIKELYYE